MHWRCRKRRLARLCRKPLCCLLLTQVVQGPSVHSPTDVRELDCSQQLQFQHCLRFCCYCSFEYNCSCHTCTIYCLVIGFFYSLGLMKDLLSLWKRWSCYLWDRLKDSDNKGKFKSSCLLRIDTKHESVFAAKSRLANADGWALGYSP